MSGSFLTGPPRETDQGGKGGDIRGEGLFLDKPIQEQQENGPARSQQDAP